MDALGRCGSSLLWGLSGAAHCLLPLPPAQSPALGTPCGLVVRGDTFSFGYTGFPWAFALEFFCVYVGIHRDQKITPPPPPSPHLSHVFFFNVLFYSIISVISRIQHLKSAETSYYLLGRDYFE